MCWGEGGGGEKTSGLTGRERLILKLWCLRSESGVLQLQREDEVHKMDSKQVEQPFLPLLLQFRV